MNFEHAQVRPRGASRIIIHYRVIFVLESGRRVGLTDVISTLRVRLEIYFQNSSNDMYTREI